MGETRNRRQFVELLFVHFAKEKKNQSKAQHHRSMKFKISCNPWNFHEIGHFHHRLRRRRSTFEPVIFCFISSNIVTSHTRRHIEARWTLRDPITTRVNFAIVFVKNKPIITGAQRSCTIACTSEINFHRSSSIYRNFRTIFRGFCSRKWRSILIGRFLTPFLWILRVLSWRALSDRPQGALLS